MVGVTTTCPELGHIRATLLPHIDHTVWWKCGGTESIGTQVYTVQGSEEWAEDWGDDVLEAQIWSVQVN